MAWFFLAVFIVIPKSSSETPRPLTVNEEKPCPQINNQLAQTDPLAFERALERAWKRMAALPHDAHVQSCVCQAIGSAVMNPKSRELRAWVHLQEQLADKLVEQAYLLEEAMNNHQADAAVQQSCLFALGSLGPLLVPQNTPKFIRLIERSMAKHPEHMSVQVEACFALSVLTSVDKDLSNGPQIELVLHALESFPNEALLQEWGLSTLASARLAERRGAQARVIRAVGSAMQAHRRNKAVAKHGLVILSGVPQVEVENLASKEHINWIVTALKDHPDDPLVQRWGIYALASYSTLSSVLDQLDEIDLEVIPLVEAAMERFSHEQQLQLPALTTWVNFANHPVILKRLGSDEQIRLIETAILNFEANEMIQQHGLMALGNMALSKSIRQKMGSEEQIYLVEMAMERHPDHIGVQQWGCRLLGIFAADSAIRTSMGSIEQLNLVEVAMISHREYPDMQIYAAYLLGHLAYQPRIRQRILDIGAEELIQSALTDYPQDQHVQKWGKFALKQLNKI